MVSKEFLEFLSGLPPSAPFWLSDWKESSITPYLKVIDEVFPYHPFYERSAVDVFELAYALRCGAVIVEIVPVSRQLNLNVLVIRGQLLHHSPDLTALVVSQLPIRDKILVGAPCAGGRCDMALPSESVYIEVGYCSVTKVLNGLEVAKEIWVLPFMGEQENLTTIYKFRCSDNGQIVLEELKAQRVHRMIDIYDRAFP